MLLEFSSEDCLKSTCLKLFHLKSASNLPEGMGVAKELRILFVRVIQGLSILTASLVWLLIQQLMQVQIKV